MRKSLLRSLGSLAIGLLVATSCERQEGVYAYEAVPVEGWHYDSAAVIVVDTLRSAGTYQADVHVRLTQQYPYEDLFLIVEQRWTPTDSTAVAGIDGMVYHRDTLALKIAPNGRDFPNVGLSRLHFYNTLPDVPLRAGYVGEVRIKPAMGVHRLRGVSDVGVRLWPEGVYATQDNWDALFRF